jgi:hypothetical protein
MLSEVELQQLSEFAQLIDRDMAARQEVIEACSLQEVVALAHANGHPMISADVLAEGANQLESTGWIWAHRDTKWSHHAFSLALLMLLRSKIIAGNKEINKPEEELKYNKIEAATFHEYCLNCSEIQHELRDATYLEQAVEIAKSHGFLVTSVDFIINKDCWTEDYFPWNRMPHKEASQCFSLWPYKSNMAADH